MIGFGSDNHSGVHPELMKSLAECNQEHAPAYGTDDWTEKSLQSFNKLFETNVDVHYCFNGTASNVLALKTFARSHHSVICSSVAHLTVDECGAPEALGGFKLVQVPHHDGKIRLEDLKKSLVRRGDQHFSQVIGVSLTQPTELGTCYSPREIREICDWAHQNQLFVHIDGARIANAVVALQSSFHEMFVKTGVDVISFGGTKNGLMMGEAVVILNSKLNADFKYIRKQMAQLPSKTRFIAHQFRTYIETGLWKKIAEHSLTAAQELKKKVDDIPGVQILYPVESNALFAKFPRHWLKPLREEFFFYVWDEHDFSCRWMCTWDTDLKTIDSFRQKLQELQKKDHS